MFESRHAPLLSRRAFLKRLAGSTAVGMSFLAVSLLAGMLGYHGYEGLSWLDAFDNAGIGALQGLIGLDHDAGGGRAEAAVTRILS